MKVQNTFKTRKAAAQYLRERGWQFVRVSLGEQLFHHPSTSYSKLIVQRKGGQWETQSWGTVVH